MAKAKNTNTASSTPSAPAVSASAVPSVPAVSAPVAPAVAPVREVRKHDKNTLNVEFNELEMAMEAEIERLRTVAASTKGGVKSAGVKQLRSFLKTLRGIHSHAQRVTRFKKPVAQSATPQNTGLLKPVRVSPEIAQFFNWSASELRSRVSVTAAVWAYIKDHALQDSENKKFILINKDGKLATLLKYDPRVHTEPVTYCTLQKFLKVHFITEPKPVKAVAPAPPAVAAPAPVEAPKAGRKARA